MKKVLIANRGEISRRVIRTLKKMNIESVAIYSDADAEAPHVYEADYAFHVGEGPSSASYLREDRILELCKNEKIDAVHPGYGFLSENAGFANKLKEIGVKLIGPSASSMDVMGDKLKAKQAVKAFDVPLVPGVDEAISDIEEAKAIAKEIKYPILIKASAGGGGKGMRLVNAEEEFEEQMQMAQNEARSSFGNDAVFIEKFVEKPRHIEIQVFADQQGEVVYLFERECSIQRRHQKVIEEAPSIVLSPEIRAKMGEAAISVCKSCNYEGAGTVEFLMDAELNFYFLEMNTRLQVEHPVTEEITGLDLVEWQLRIARGEKLPKSQDELKINGHAIEVRVYAEDSLNGFVPDIGTLNKYVRPFGSGIRVDDAFEEGMAIPIYYDPMIAKLVVWAESRDACIEKCIDAIKSYQISGVKTTLDFGLFVLNHESFRSGDFDTNFIKTHVPESKAIPNSMKDESDALLGSLDEIWNDLVKMKNTDFKSQKITESWKNQTNS